MALSYHVRGGPKNCSDTTFWIDAVYGAIILIALVVSWATGGTAEET